MATTIVSLILSISLVSAAALNEEFQFSGFNPGNGNSNLNLSLDGNAEIDKRGILRLTNETLRLIGHAFHPFPIRFKNSSDGSVFSFSTCFAFSIIPEYPKLGGHGLAFTISKSAPLPAALPSQYLGLLNAQNMGNASDHLFAVEFDTVQDFEFGDINDNHVGVDLNSLTSNRSVPSPVNLKSGDTIQAWIDYDSTRKVLDVWLACSSTKPTNPILTYAVDLSPILQTQMRVGFSASTGLLASSHYVFGWNFKMNGGAADSLDLSFLPSLPTPKKKNYTLLISAPVFALLFLMTGLASAGYLFYKIKTADTIEEWELVTGPHRFSYKELKHATRGFREKGLLGQGGFGKVYKGVLPGTKEEVAVKRVSHESKQGLREFVAEIASIGRLRHRNLVRMQGWCRRRSDLFLVYDYMPNGSLDKYLFCSDDRQGLPWPIRFRVIRGVAAALLYLHEAWESVVVHRDVKASNVLLDGELNGRLGDFGLARLYERGANPATTTRVVGTLGYLAPELTRTGKASTATDVFAFGALALEVVCGRRPIEPKASPAELVLVDLVWENWALGRWREVVDPQLNAEFDEVEAEMALRVGLMCSHPSPEARPEMRDVVRFFEDGDLSGLPEISSPGERYEPEFDDFVHSYPSSSFEKVSWSSHANQAGAKPGGLSATEGETFLDSSPV